MQPRSQLTHLAMASHVAIMHDRQILQYGEMQDVYLRPTHMKSGEYFSDPPMNFFNGHVSDGYAAISDDFKIPLSAMEVDLPEGNYMLGIRPHHIEVLENGSTEDTVNLNAVVELSEIVGSDTTLHLSHRGLEFIALSRSLELFALDETIRVSLNPRQIHVFDAQNQQIISNAAAAR